MLLLPLHKVALFVPDQTDPVSLTAVFKNVRMLRLKVSSFMIVPGMFRGKRPADPPVIS